MANIKDDPKVQELINKSVEKALKAQRKAIVSAVKETVGNVVDAAKADGEKASAKILKELGNQVLEAAKSAEPAEA